MAAIEYGSYYWCVILNGPEGKTESIHLHADEVGIEKDGTLAFRSAGRRPAGAVPGNREGQKDNNEKNSNSPGGGGQAGKESGDDEGENSKPKMIYVAFAPGSWRIFYAAKLQDGGPASVEHWNADRGHLEGSPIPANSGAIGYPPTR